MSRFRRHCQDFVRHCRTRNRNAPCFSGMDAIIGKWNTSLELRQIKIRWLFQTTEVFQYCIMSWIDEQHLSLLRRANKLQNRLSFYKRWVWVLALMLDPRPPCSVNQLSHFTQSQCRNRFCILCCLLLVGDPLFSTFLKTFQFRWQIVYPKMQYTDHTF